MYMKMLIVFQAAVEMNVAHFIRIFPSLFRFKFRDSDNFIMVILTLPTTMVLLYYCIVLLVYFTS